MYGYGRKSWEVEGYAFNADTYCPVDALNAYLAGKVDNPEEFAYYLTFRGGFRGVEGAFEILARMPGRETQDSACFPQPEFSGGLHDSCHEGEGYEPGQCGRRCSACHEIMGESCPNVPEGE